MTPSLVPPEYRLTYADWLALPDDGPRYEIIGGELFVNPLPNARHERISRELGEALELCLSGPKRGDVFYAPIGVKLSNEDVPQPDLVVVLAKHKDRIGERVIEGAPDLVVEILAQRIDPSTVAVADFMSSEPLTAHEDDSLWQTIRRMSAHGVRRMPVVDARGSLVGLLSVDDILDLLSAELSQLTTLAIREQTREKEVRP